MKSFSKLAEIRFKYGKLDVLRHENSFLQLERENQELFLFKNFSRSRLLSRSAVFAMSLSSPLFASTHHRRWLSKCVIVIVVACQSKKKP